MQLGHILFSASSVGLILFVGQSRKLDLLNFFNLIEIVYSCFLISLQCLQISNNVPTLLLCENLIPSRHSRTGDTFAGAIEPHRIVILFVERTSEVSWFLFQRDRVWTVASAFKTVASSAVLCVDTTSGVGAGRSCRI